MKIVSLCVKNFKSIQHAEMDKLGESIVIAGANGCGKSTILDSIKLIKSAYGQWYDNELKQLYTELSIQDLSADAKKITRDHTKPLEIEISFTLEKDEKEYIRKTAPLMIRNRMWEQYTGRKSQRSSLGLIQEEAIVVPPAQRARFEAQVEEQARLDIEKIEQELALSEYHLGIYVTPGAEVMIRPSLVMEIVFSTDNPSDLGVIEFHSPNRSRGFG